MPPTKESLRRLQIGVETTRFTSVPATRYLSISGGDWAKVDTRQDFFAEGSDTLAIQAQSSQIATEHTEVSPSMTFSFEDVLFPLLAGVRGGVTPSTPNAGNPPRLWTFAPQRQANPNPTPFTLEHVIDDGATEYGEEAAGAWCDSFTINCTADALPTMELSLMADPTAAGTAASLSPVTLQRPSSALSWALYRDSTWAGAGTTAVPRAQSATLVWAGAMRGDRSGENKANGGFTNADVVPGRNVQLNATILLEPGTASLYRQELSRRKGIGNPEIWRLEINGPTIDATSGLPYTFACDFAAEHLPGSLGTIGPVVDGLQTVELILRSREYYDGTTRRDIQFAVQNTLATYP